MGERYQGPEPEALICDFSAARNARRSGPADAIQKAPEAAVVTLRDGGGWQGRRWEDAGTTGVSTPDRQPLDELARAISSVADMVTEDGPLSNIVVQGALPSHVQEVWRVMRAFRSIKSPARRRSALDYVLNQVQAETDGANAP